MTGVKLGRHFSVDSMNEIKARMVSGEINPGQLSIVREIIDEKTTVVPGRLT